MTLLLHQRPEARRRMRGGVGAPGVRAHAPHVAPEPTRKGPTPMLGGFARGITGGPLCSTVVATVVGCAWVCVAEAPPAGAPPLVNDDDSADVAGERGTASTMSTAAGAPAVAEERAAAAGADGASRRRSRDHRPAALFAVDAGCGSRRPLLCPPLLRDMRASACHAHADDGWLRWPPPPHGIPCINRGETTPFLFTLLLSGEGGERHPGGRPRSDDLSPPRPCPPVSSGGEGGHLGDVLVGGRPKEDNATAAEVDEQDEAGDTPIGIFDLPLLVDDEAALRLDDASGCC